MTKASTATVEYHTHTQTHGDSPRRNVSFVSLDTLSVMFWTSNIIL